MKIGKRVTILVAGSVFAFSYLLNFINTDYLSSMTKTRDFVYFSWQEITQRTDFFKQVRDRDILIAQSQDDSYEYNAGSFFSNTGIRLAYFYKTNVLFPNLEKCKVQDECVLPDLMETIKATLPNLSRTTKNDKTDAKKDWVANNMQLGALEGINVWATDRILLTPNDVFMYLTQFENKDSATTLKFNGSIGVLISKGGRSFSPALGGICMKLDGTWKAQHNSTWEITLWRFDALGETPANSVVGVPEQIDYRNLEVGTCAK
jgi:hypothetical protein